MYSLDHGRLHSSRAVQHRVQPGQHCGPHVRLRRLGPDACAVGVEQRAIESLGRLSHLGIEFAGAEDRLVPVDAHAAIQAVDRQPLLCGEQQQAVRTLDPRECRRIRTDDDLVSSDARDVGNRQVMSGEQEGVGRRRGLSGARRRREAEQHAR